MPVVIKPSGQSAPDFTRTDNQDAGDIFPAAHTPQAVHPPGVAPTDECGNAPRCSAQNNQARDLFVSGNKNEQKQKPACERHGFDGAKAFSPRAVLPAVAISVQRQAGEDDERGVEEKKCRIGSRPKNFRQFCSRKRFERIYGRDSEPQPVNSNSASANENEVGARQCGAVNESIGIMRTINASCKGGNMLLPISRSGLASSERADGRRFQ